MVAAAKAGPDGVPIRFVTIGAASAPSIGLPSAALRSSSLTLMGSGVGSIGLPEDTRRDRRGVAGGAARQTANRPTTPVALSAVAEVWGHGNSDSRLVFTV